MAKHNTTTIIKQPVVAAIIAIVMLLFSSHVLAQHYRIGVLAQRGREACLQQWGPTAEYLTQRIDNAVFLIEPLDSDYLLPAVETEEVDFVIVNPAIYVSLSEHYGVSRMVTMKDIHWKQGCALSGGVIFTSAKSDIHLLQDLSGRTFMAVSENSFAGWQAAWREFKELGIEPDLDFARLHFGGTEESVVRSVLSERVDAGTIRSATLERMESAGELNFDDIRILSANAQEIALGNQERRLMESFPFVHSTRLYPEWPFAKTAAADDEIARKVAAALLSMPEDSEAANAAHCAGWTVPYNYTSVHDCLKTLKIGPYEYHSEIDFEAMLVRYKWWIYASIALAVLTVAFLVRMLLLNKVLKTTVKARKKAEEQIRKQKLHYQALVSNIPGAVYRCANDMNWTMNFLSDGVEQLTGYLPTELIDNSVRSYASLIHPDDVKKVDKLVQEGVEKKEPYSIYYRIVHKNGSIRHVYERGRGIFDENGELMWLDGSIFDVTERVIAVERARRAHENFKKILMNSPFGVVLIDRERKIRWANEYMRKLAGVDTVSELYHKHCGEYLCPAQQKECPILDFGKEVDNSERILRRFNGTEIPIIKTVTEIELDGENLLLETLIDITEHKRTETKFRTLFNSCHDAIMILDDMGFIDCNDTAVEMFGVKDKEEICSSHPADFSPLLQPCGTESLLLAKQKMQETAERGKCEFEWVHIRKDTGEEFPVEVRLNAMELDGRIVFQGILHDITSRKEAENKLKESQQFLQTVIDAIPDAMTVVDRDYRICLANKTVRESVEGEDPVGQQLTCHQVSHHCDTPCTGENDPCPIPKVLEKQAPVTVEHNHFTDQNEDSEKRIVEVTAAPVFDGEGNITHIVESSRDVTARREAEKATQYALSKLELAHLELKQMQSQIVQNAKMASIGALAAGVAHEINTPLGFIASNFDTLQKYLGKLPQVMEGYRRLSELVAVGTKEARLEQQRKMEELCSDMQADFILQDIPCIFDESREGLERVESIVKHLRSFAHVDQVQEVGEYDLNDGLETTLAVAKKDLDDVCEVTKECSDLPVIQCISGQINQVIMNILVNAMQAIKSQHREEKGSILIRTYATDHDVVCEITDDGPGIDEKVLDRIFDPFYSSETNEMGTGLGLSIAYDIIVKKHQGELLVENIKDKGAKFTIKLPKAPKPVCVY